MALPQHFNLEAPHSNIAMHNFEGITQMSMMVQPAPYIVPVPTWDIEYEKSQYNQGYVPENIETFKSITSDNIYANKDSSDPRYSLYLCKDDFEPYNSAHAEYLKKFLVGEIFKATAESYGWTPDFMLKGLQSLYRYEVATNDEKSRDWLINFDFSQFDLFNVLVYTKLELWYERAAIWLPDHSRSRNIEPLEKLKLQNKRLEGIDIAKWKFVKKIVTEKGTRIYVDMPPSSARALEKYKMLLSYELQKVSVYLKAVAVDKDSFDAGLKQSSVLDQSLIIAAAQNSHMPSLNKDPNVILITLKGNKTMSVSQARKIKEMIIYHIFKYHQKDGIRKTDFLKYGFCMPGYFGLLPENEDTKRWLLNLDIGKLNRHQVVVLGSDVDNNSTYVNMTFMIPNESGLVPNKVQERLKNSNKGVQGLKFHVWKPLSVTNSAKHIKDKEYEVSVDLESAEQIAKLNFQLDYSDGFRTYIATAKCEYSHLELEQLKKKHKEESEDTYDVANMEIESSDEDVVYLG